jgi:DNA polymerase-1
MAPRPAPGGDRSGNFVSTPQTLAAARTEAARSAKFERSRYETVRSLDRLNAWIERARGTGIVALDAATPSGDPMQAELCGFSLAVAPNEACYVPLSHRQGGDGEGGGLFRGDVLADQIPERAAPIRACSRSGTT